MKFYKIETKLKNAKKINEMCDEGPHYSRSTEFSEGILYRSEQLYKQSGKHQYIFVSNFYPTSNRMSLCLITDEPCDPEAILTSFATAQCIEIDKLNGLTIEFERIDIDEITFPDFFYSLNDAAHNEFIKDDDTILDRFNLRDLYTVTRRNSAYEEWTLDEPDDKTFLTKYAKRIHVGETLLPELDRIFKGSTNAKVYGQPVHYIIECADPFKGGDICDHLLPTLYSQGRIKNGRYAILELSNSTATHFDEHFLHVVYDANTDGAVVITLDRCDLQAGEHATMASEALKEICSAALAHRNNVLTIFRMNNTCQPLIDIISDSSGTMSFVEIKDDPGLMGDDATQYLKDCAKEKHIRADSSLLAFVKDPQTLYTIKELDAAFGDWYDKKLKSTIYPQYQVIKTREQKIQESSPNGSALDQLNSLIGLDNAKSLIQKALTFYKVQKMYKDRSIDIENPAMHMVFTGNPGTAKTTVARLFAHILRENHILEGGELIEVGRADLVGQYVGQTAPKVQKVFKEAKGNVLFIDEAYSLVDDRDGLYGDEAINTIVQEMENLRGETIVIFAGYPDKMEGFLKKNPGLRSRIAFHIPFSDYSTDELCDIAELMARQNNWILAPGCREQISLLSDSARKQADFGNGRFIRNLFESARMEQANRIVSLDPATITDETLHTLIPEDFNMPVMQDKRDSGFIGF